MNPWYGFPFIRLLLPYISGIIIAFLLPRHPELLRPVSLLLCVVCIPLSIYAKKIPYKFRHVYGFFLFISLLFLGLNMGALHMQKPDFSDFPGNPGYYLISISEAPSETPKSIKIIGFIAASEQNAKIPANRYKALLYLQKDSLARQLKYGDNILIDAGLEEPKAPQNPYEFNYKRYLHNKKIYFQAFVSSKSWKLIKPGGGNMLKKGALEIRNYLLDILKKKGTKGKEFEVAAAILLGYDEILDPDTRSRFSNAGAMHVLCVSGLHVGVIYLMLNTLLAFFTKNKKAGAANAFFILPAIWIYALVTGFSPSVLRASAMISFIIIGDALHRKGNIYNSLAASAFLLLLINPLMIRDVGFQLSYAAVIAIVSVYPVFKKMVFIPNKILQKFWSILLVSLAAQLGTFAIVIFYFHQFPVYFLLSNMLVVLLAGFIINTGFVFFILSGIPYASDILAYVLNKMLWFMHNYVNIIDALPGSVIKGMVINLAELILIYLLVTGIFKILLTKNKYWLYASLVIVLIAGSSFTLRNFRQKHNRKFIVYNIPGRAAWDFVSGNKNRLFADSSLLKDQKRIDFHIQNFWWKAGIGKPDKLPLSFEYVRAGNFPLLKKAAFMQFYASTFLIVDSKFPSFSKPAGVSVDYVLLTGNPSVSIDTIYALWHPKLIIVDASNSFSREKKWIAQMQKKNIPCYFVSRSGAFVMDFN